MEVFFLLELYEPLKFIAAKEKIREEKRVEDNFFNTKTGRKNYFSRKFDVKKISLR